jgi:dihydrodipicolinate synthase/N-acetylneuraminate lyase
MTSAVNLYCRTATTFAPDGSFDEDAFRLFLQRFIDNNIGVYLASLGSGESGAMTYDELRRVYRVGVETCKGKVPVHGNPPEKLSVDETRAHVMLAIEAGVEIVNVYGPAAWHGYHPTNEEFFSFFDELLTPIKHPIAFSPNAMLGKSATAEMLATLCDKHPQIVAINLISQSDEYFIELQDRLKRDVELNVPFQGSLETMLLGATAVIGAEMNMIPETHRRYLDLYEQGKFPEAALVYADIARFNQYVGKWRSAHPRWIKMMMKAFAVPGWAVRGPYRMPPDAELKTFVAGLVKLGLPEIDALARTLG